MKLGKALLVASFLVLASRAQAQPTASHGDTFGTQDGIDLWIPASAFVGASGTWEAAVDPNAPSYLSAPLSGAFYALLPLPQGAYLDSWRMFYYDAAGDPDLAIYLKKAYDDVTGSPTHADVTLGEATSSGAIGYASTQVDQNLTIDLREPLPGSGVTRNDAADFYYFYLQMGNPFAFKGVRVFWHRQVSPAPVTATFNDVPTSDPAFQFIEALAASGITAGCGGGNFCPDAPLTRRQMAVFLSKALGLHWPPF